MNFVKQSVEAFFKRDAFVNSSIENTHYFTYLEESILEFLDNEDKKTAFEVYNNYFDCLKTLLVDNHNFIDLLDILKLYEENVSIMIDKQRDHYVHSVNVFVLGLMIYQNNSNYSKTYNMSKDTKYKEINFIYEWGLTSLCHDIGYPYEITHRQINEFSDFLTKKEVTGDSISVSLEFNKIDSLFNIHNELTNQNAIELLSKTISSVYELEYDKVYNQLFEFPLEMKKDGYVDHGYFSAIIVLKWYYLFIESSSEMKIIDPNFQLSVATSILLHNFYRFTYMKPPFNLGKLDATKDPLSFLIILCDELQDWNRQAYGRLDLLKPSAKGLNCFVDDNKLKLVYLTLEDEMESDFVKKKENLLNNVLQLDNIFNKGLVLKTETMTDSFVRTIKSNNYSIKERPLFQNIEKIAIEIHRNYVNKQKEKNEEITYETWESLPQTLKYSNVRQARDMINKLSLINCYASKPIEHLKRITQFTKNEIEYLSEIEHISWVEERLSKGWRLGKEKDVEKKISPYLVEYSELTESIKELDRDAVRNIIPILEKIGMFVYRL